MLGPLRGRKRYHKANAGNSRGVNFRFLTLAYRAPEEAAR